MFFFIYFALSPIVLDEVDVDCLAVVTRHDYTYYVFYRRDAFGDVYPIETLESREPNFDGETIAWLDTNVKPNVLRRCTPRTVYYLYVKEDYYTELTIPNARRLNGQRGFRRN
jgi:hypothetical protein